MDLILFAFLLKRIMHANPRLTWARFQLPPLKAWGFEKPPSMISTCTVCSSDEDENSRPALTGDKHLEQEGFAALLK